MEDDIYKGMHIPKGSIVFGNIWRVYICWLIIYHSADLHRRAMLRNEKVYPDPHTFRPERFLEPVTPEMERKRNPKNYVFGFGRRSVFRFYKFISREAILTLHDRQCPGLDLAHSSVWLLIASVLATLDILKAVDEHGKIIEPVVQFDNPIFR
jgi:cytochrome P450